MVGEGNKEGGDRQWSIGQAGSGRGRPIDDVCGHEG